MCSNVIAADDVSIGRKEGVADCLKEVVVSLVTISNAHGYVSLVAPLLEKEVLSTYSNPVSFQPIDDSIAMLNVGGGVKGKEEERDTATQSTVSNPISEWTIGSGAGRYGNDNTMTCT